MGNAHPTVGKQSWTQGNATNGGTPIQRYSSLLMGILWVIFAVEYNRDRRHVQANPPGPPGRWVFLCSGGVCSKR